MEPDVTTIKQRLVDHYDRGARQYHEANYARKEAYSALQYRQFYIERMIENQAVPKGARILDVGCGPGELVLSLRNKGYDVWGVDISPVMVSEAIALLHGNGFMEPGRIAVGDIETLEFDDCSFDVVVAAGVIEYQRDDERALSEMHRVLKPGGLLILNVTNRYSYLGILDGVYRWLKKHRATRRLLGLVKSRLLGRGELHDFPDRRTHVPHAFDRDLVAFGFTKTGHNYFHFAPLPTPLDSVFAAWCKPAGRWLERFTDRPLGRLLGGGYLVMARRANRAAPSGTRATATYPGGSFRPLSY